MATPSIAIIPSAYKTGVLAAVLPNNGNADLDFTRGTTATRVNAQGLIEEVGVNVPRLDYSDGVCPSSLLEPQSSNLVNSSELLNSYFTTKVDTTITDNYGTSPSGQVNSSRIQFADATSFCYSTINVSTEHTASVFVKGTIGETVKFGIGGNITTGGLFTFNGMWQRIEYTTSSASQIFFSTYSGATARDFKAFGLQLEQQSYATSYMPTQGTPITREADFASKTGLSSYINSSEGVLYADISASEYSEQIQRISISDSSDKNKIHLQFIKNTNGLNVLIRSADAPVFEKPYILNDVTAFNKIALKWKINDFSLWVNGVNAWSINAGNTPLVLNRIGFDSGNNSFPFYGKFKDLRVYTTALTDAELQTLTTL